MSRAWYIHNPPCFKNAHSATEPARFLSNDPTAWSTSGLAALSNKCKAIEVLQSSKTSYKLFDAFYLLTKTKTLISECSTLLGYITLLHFQLAVQPCCSSDMHQHNQFFRPYTLFALEFCTLVNLIRHKRKPYTKRTNAL